MLNLFLELNLDVSVVLSSLVFASGSCKAYLISTDSALFAAPLSLGLLVSLVYSFFELTASSITLPGFYL